MLGTYATCRPKYSTKAYENCCCSMDPPVALWARLRGVFVHSYCCASALAKPTVSLKFEVKRQHGDWLTLSLDAAMRKIFKNETHNSY